MKKIIMPVLLGCIMLAGCKDDDDNEMTKGESTTTPATGQGAVPAATEILPMSAADPIRQSFDAFARKDAEGFTAPMSDNVRHVWSSGDSLVGKQAVKDYFNGRFQLIDSIEFSDHIFLPITSKESQSASVPAGKWVLHWAMVHVKYKNGKNIHFWTHQANHYDSTDRIDFIAQYQDRHQIMEATKGMKRN